MTQVSEGTSQPSHLELVVPGHWRLPHTAESGDVERGGPCSLSWGLEFVVLGFPGGSDGKKSACNVGEPGFDTWVGKIPWRRAWQPISVLLPGESHGHRSLEDCSPSVTKSRTQLSTAQQQQSWTEGSLLPPPAPPKGHSHRWQLPQWLGFASWALVGPLRPP